MEKLLQWSIAQQSGDKEAMDKIGQPDPKMLQQLFGGPDEPTLMTQAILVVDNPEATLENKEVAFENFEMLIENLDNANNIENLKLWPKIIAQLLSTELSLLVLAASIVGIATQNNPNSQEAFLKQEGGLQQLITLASDEKTPKELLLKVLFAMSSLVRNFADATEQFTKLGGWKVLDLLVSKSNHKELLRKLSLLSALLSTGLDDAKTEHLHSDKVVGTLIHTLTADGHIGCIDKALNILTQLQALGFKFSSSEISQLAKNLDNIESLKDQLAHDDFNAAKQVVS